MIEIDCPMLTPAAIHILKQVKGTILTKEDSYDQDNWGCGDSACHTPCCIAGHICLIVDGKIPNIESGITVCERARQILGLSIHGTRELFSGYPIKLSAKEGAALIDGFIAKYTPQA